MAASVDDRRTDIAIVFVGGGDCYRVLRREPMLSSRVYVWQEFRRLDREQVLAVIPAYHPVWAGADPEDIAYADVHAGHGNFRAWAKITAHVVTALARLDRSRPTGRSCSGSSAGSAAVAAEVRVLLDPGDDMQVCVGLLESHDPARGRVIVHPTPGASSPQALAHDLLGALGRAVNRLTAEQLAGPAAGRAVTAWIVTDQIDDLVVLRADRLSAGAWTWVLGLCRETGSRVLLVCHTRQIPAHLNAVLAGTGYQLLIGLPQALRGAGPRPRPGQMGRRGRA